jgi:hypothetical protein
MESTNPPDDAEIAPAAMLRGADLGTGVQENDDAVQHHGSLSMLLAYCGQDVGAGLEWLAGRNRAFASGDGAEAGHQEAHRYASDGATRFMDELRDQLPRCERIENGGNPQDVSALAVLASDFAGDDSLLVEELRTVPDGTTSTIYHAAVRRGDVYAQVIMVQASEAEALEIAKVAAQRLCEATTTC